MTAVLFFLAGSLAVVTAVTAPVLTEIRIARDTVDSKQSYFVAEAGGEDAAYRLRETMELSDTETLSLAGGIATVSVTDTTDGRQVAARGDLRNRIRTTEQLLTEDDHISFHYGVQVGTGGIELRNTASIVGNVYSNGVVEGADNVIQGTVVSAGPGGLIDSVHATSSAYAHTITEAEVDGDAYYQTIENTTVHGTRHPGSDDRATISLPISDEQIAQWQQAAEGGVLNQCLDEEGDPQPTLDITQDTTIGPEKIMCDVSVGGNVTVTLSGAVWIVGDLTIKNQAELVVDSALSGKSVPVIADDPGAAANGGHIRLQNKTSYRGAGGGSYVLLLSQNTSAEDGGTDAAIEVQNTATGDLLVYARHGLIEVQNSVGLKEVSAYQILIRNSAEVVYESGLANSLFDAGPGGSYEVVEWKEVK